MSNPSVWDLIVAGKYEQACIEANVEFAATGSLLPLRNKVLALLNLYQYHDAIQVCRYLIETRSGETDSDFIFSGIAHWFLDQHTEALEMWRAAKDAKYTDAAGGVIPPLLILFAGVKLRNVRLEREARTLLKKRSKSRRMINWPGPLASYMLADIDERELLERISAQPSLKARQTCQAMFYIAVRRLVANDTMGYHQLLQQSVELEFPCRLEQEYYLARGELFHHGMVR